jgi:hypothetical protein
MNLIAVQTRAGSQTGQQDNASDTEEFSKIYSQVEGTKGTCNKGLGREFVSKYKL